MRRACAVLASIIVVANPAASHAETPWDWIADAWRSVWDAAPRVEPPTSPQREASAAIRQICEIAARSGIERVSASGGFAGAYRIRLPGRLGETQRVLAPLGQSGPLDRLEDAINAAAEATAPSLETELVQSARSLDAPDPLALVRGGDEAVSRYLQQSLSPGLLPLLRERLAIALETSGAFRALGPATALAGSGPPMSSLRAELIEYAADRTLAGVFAAMADAEREIRHDPARYPLEPLRRTFSSVSS